MTKLIFATLCTIALAACDSGGNQAGTTDGTHGTSAALPNNGTPPSENKGTPTVPELGVSCHDSAKRCVALKYVVLKDSSGTPIINAAQALSNLNAINALWKQCGIGFQIDKYIEARPADYGLNFSPSAMGELDSIRRAFSDDTTLLTATVGEWAFSANAWTAMPGADPYGAIMEQSVASYPAIIAHELGHYLNLDHAGSAEYLMYYMIYTTSTQISAYECTQAQAAIDYFWPKMLR